MLFVLFLTLPVPISDKEKKIKLNFYFLTSLWCLKRFYEGLKGGLYEAPRRSVKINCEKSLKINCEKKT